MSFSKTFQHIDSHKKLEYLFPKEALFSYPVAVRRKDKFFDGFFVYNGTVKNGMGKRPFGWVLLSMLDDSVSLASECEAIDFISTTQYPLDGEVSMKLPDSTAPGKIKRLRSELYEVYARIREFAFEENLSRDQVADIVRYKDLFMQLCHKGLYPFYHALSPAFFHWLRLPLPEQAPALVQPDKEETREYQYQLLILENLQQLVKQFQDKISVDTHKEKLFDQLHKEVQEYKSGLLDELTRHLELDVIRVIDGLVKTLESFSGKLEEPDAAQRLFTMLEGAQTDLEDVLYRQGIDPYTNPGDAVDIARQATISTVPTEDASLDKKICTRLSRGWEKQGRIVRPERVMVYLYNEAQS